MLILGIESSCDETGTALIDSEKGLLAHRIHTQIDMHRAYGGVVPELASRDHIRRVLALTDEVLEEAGKTRSDLGAIAVTEGPGLAGALLVGISVAHAIGYALGIPVIGVHHLEGHLLASLLADPAPRFPFVWCRAAIHNSCVCRSSEATSSLVKRWMTLPAKRLIKPLSFSACATRAVPESPLLLKKACQERSSFLAP